jgi:hypothetical protein
MLAGHEQDDDVTLLAISRCAARQGGLFTGLGCYAKFILPSGVSLQKDGLFTKGFSYHTSSKEQAIACIIPPGSIAKKSPTSASG